ncbi:DUF1850 domain-containing protein, partial [Aquisalimonas sp.]|uniref:DUF1850 domain-containing protein n=1 Tax=Aquisalimonas sp. TaxID=1872621 RepID=UPI0025C58100
GPIRTCVEGFKFAITAFIIPFMFVYNPTLLLLGDVQWLELLWVVATGLIGVYALAVMKEGWWLTRANALERLIMTGAAILLIAPSLAIDLAGFALMGLIFAFQTFKLRRERHYGVHQPTVLQRGVMGAGIIAVPLVAGVMFLPVVTVTDGADTWSRIALPGNQVAISHVHSVEQTRVDDEFRVGWRGELIHRRSITRSYGAGLPADARPRDGVLVTRGTGERYRRIDLAYLPENEPVLHLGDTEVSLLPYLDGERLAVETMWLWQYLHPGRP